MMNPEMFNDPQKFLWPFIQAKEAQRELEDKLVEVEDNFAMMQAILGMLMDNPWLYALFLRREVRRIEPAINGVAQKEIDKLNDKISQQEALILKLRSALVAVWDLLKTNICSDDVFVTDVAEKGTVLNGLPNIRPEDNGIFFEGLHVSNPENARNLKHPLLTMVRNYLIQAGVPEEVLSVCPPDPPVID